MAGTTIQRPAHVQFGFFGKRALLPVLCIMVAFAHPLRAQTAPEDDADTTGGYTLEDVPEDDGGVINHTFWGVDLGLSIPTGSSKRFNSPLFVDFFEAPRPFSEFYREGFTVNFYAGMITELGFEASLSFRATKINYSNEGESEIQTALEDIGINGAENDLSSYLLGTQAYIGQRMNPISRRGESLYFGVAAELSTLKHYSNFIPAPEEGAFSFSFIAGDEIPLQKDPHSFQMLTLRLQGEFNAFASNDRPRFFHLTFGLRGYFR
ncbi:MAG: hypothetical protein ACE5GA_02635 [Candidatus Zixiibacteriota bacterium]